MYKTFEPRINKARLKLERLLNNSAPTVPIYDLTPFEGNHVLQLTSLTNTGDVERQFASTYSHLYLTVDVAFNPATISYMLANNNSYMTLVEWFSADRSDIWHVWLNLVSSGGVLGWNLSAADGLSIYNSAIYFPSTLITSMKKYHIFWNFNIGPPIMGGVSPLVFIDGTSPFSFLGGNWIPGGKTMAGIDYVDLENIVGVLDASVKTYYDDFIVETSPGAQDLFTDDFESGSLSGWNSYISADASIIPDPGLV